jgi:aminopeptidase N
VNVDIYGDNQKERHQIWLQNSLDTLTFKLTAKPQLINVDAEKIILTQKSDHKTPEEFLFQYKNAPLFMDRYEAIQAAGQNKNNLSAQKILIEALKDPYYGLRLKALTIISPADTGFFAKALPYITRIAGSDNNNLVRAAAISILNKTKNNKQFLPIYQEGIKSQSYKVAGASLNAIAQILSNDEIVALARSLKQDSRGALSNAIVAVFAKHGIETEWPYVYSKFKAADPESRANLIPVFLLMVTRLHDPLHIRQGLEAINDLALEFKSAELSRQLVTALEQMKVMRQKIQDQTTITLIDNSIRQINNIR